MNQKPIVWKAYCGDCGKHRVVTSTGVIVTVASCSVCGSELHLQPLSEAVQKPSGAKKKNAKDEKE